MTTHSSQNISKVVWLTGSASGLGQHLTQCFIDKGYCVVATDIAYQELKNHASLKAWPKDRTLVAKLDVTRPDNWKKLFDRIMSKWGRLDLMLNIAGYLKPGYVSEVESIEVDRHIDINVKGVIYGSQIAAQKMIQQGHGHIINIASLAGIAPIPGISLYSTSKFAVRGFSLALAQELKPHGVNVTVVCPDAIQTPMLKLQEDYEEAALTFSAPKTLTVEDLEHLVFKSVLDKAPLEVSLPVSRGILAKIGNTFPASTMVLGQILKKQGLKSQAKRKQGRA